MIAYRPIQAFIIGHSVSEGASTCDSAQEKATHTHTPWDLTGVPTLHSTASMHSDVQHRRARVAVPREHDSKLTRDWRTRQDHTRTHVHTPTRPHAHSPMVQHYRRNRHVVSITCSRGFFGAPHHSFLEIGDCFIESKMEVGKRWWGSNRIAP